MMFYLCFVLCQVLFITCHVSPVTWSGVSTRGQTDRQQTDNRRTSPLIDWIGLGGSRVLPLLLLLLLCTSHSCYPTRTLKRGGLESPGQRLISSNGITKIIFFSLKFLFNCRFLGTKIIVLDFSNFWVF